MLDLKQTLNLDPIIPLTEDPQKFLRLRAAEQQRFAEHANYVNRAHRERRNNERQQFRQRMSKCSVGLPPKRVSPRTSPPRMRHPVFLRNEAKQQAQQWSSVGDGQKNGSEVLAGNSTMINMREQSLAYDPSVNIANYHQQPQQYYYQNTRLASHPYYNGKKMASHPQLNQYQLNPQTAFNFMQCQQLQQQWNQVAQVQQQQQHQMHLNQYLFQQHQVLTQSRPSPPQQQQYLQPNQINLNEVPLSIIPSSSHQYFQQSHSNINKGSSSVAPSPSQQYLQQSQVNLNEVPLAVIPSPSQQYVQSSPQQYIQPNHANFNTASLSIAPSPSQQFMQPNQSNLNRNPSSIAPSPAQQYPMSNQVALNESSPSLIQSSPQQYIQLNQGNMNNVSSSTVQSPLQQNLQENINEQYKQYWQSSQQMPQFPTNTQQVSLASPYGQQNAATLGMHVQPASNQQVFYPSPATSHQSPAISPLTKNVASIPTFQAPSSNGNMTSQMQNAEGLTATIGAKDTSALFGTIDDEEMVLMMHKYLGGIPDINTCNFPQISA